MGVLNDILAEMRGHEGAPEWLDSLITNAETAANDLTSGFNATVKGHEETAAKNAAEIQRLQAENYKLMTSGSFGGQPGSQNPDAGKTPATPPSSPNADIVAQVAGGKFEWF